MTEEPLSFRPSQKYKVQASQARDNFSSFALGAIVLALRPVDSGPDVWDLFNVNDVGFAWKRDRQVRICLKIDDDGHLSSAVSALKSH
jgi:hypothetical protein